VLKTGVVLTFSEVEDTVEKLTVSLFTAERVFSGKEKLNDAVTAVEEEEVKSGLVSNKAVGFELSSLDAVKLNVENGTVSGFELKLKVANVVSFTGTVSLFFNLFSVLEPEHISGVSKSVDNVVGVSNLKLANDVFLELSILFCIESVKLKVIVLFFDTVDSLFSIDTLVKLKGIFSFDSFVPEITSKVDFVKLLQKFKFEGKVDDGFKLKSTGSLLEMVLFANNGLLEALKIGSLGRIV